MVSNIRWNYILTIKLYLKYEEVCVGVKYVLVNTNPFYSAKRSAMN